MQAFSLAVFGVGVPELLIVGGIALVLFGSRLPQAMRSLGLGLKELKSGLQGEEEKQEAIP